MHNKTDPQNVVLFNILREVGTKKIWSRRSLKKFILPEVLANRWISTSNDEEHDYARGRCMATSIPGIFHFEEERDFLADPENDNMRLRIFHSSNCVGHRLFRDIKILIGDNYCKSKFTRWQNCTVGFVRRQALVKCVSEPVNCARSNQLIKLRFDLTYSFVEILEEIFEFCTKFMDISAVTKAILVNVSSWVHRCKHSLDEYLIEFFAYMLKRRVDATTLDESEFNVLVTQLVSPLRNLQLVPSIALLIKFLMDATKRDAEKFKLVCETFVKHSAFYVKQQGNEALNIVGYIINSVDSIDIGSALLTVDFSSVCRLPMTKSKFDDLVKICKLFIDSGARLNPPLPQTSAEQSFLIQIVQASQLIGKEQSCVFEFISYCVNRGARPSAHGMSSEGIDLIGTVCSLYKAENLCYILKFLLSCESETYRTSMSKFHLRSLRSNIPYRSNIHEAIGIFLRNGIDDAISHDAPNVLNVLANFPLYHVANGCCRYGALHRMNDFKFWDLLHHLVTIGVDINCKNDCGYTPFAELLYGTSRKMSSVDLCQECSLEYFGKERAEVRIACIGTNHFTGALTFFERLLQAGVNTLNLAPFSEYKTALCFICCHLEVAEIIALAELFCENGIDVDAARKVEAHFRDGKGTSRLKTKWWELFGLQQSASSSKRLRIAWQST